ncbi:MAG TPA: hypothetical protein VNZ86_13065, partial [Bacteroidia bacterium]|nr:hypothetical protein [Bacteroidia bacterium]
KENTVTPGPPAPGFGTISVASLLSSLAPPMQSYSVDAVNGGFFTTSQGTKVIIPPNAFQTQSGQSLNGSLRIQFKDLYKKSDMLFSDMPTTMNTGAPLKSAGEFFIRVFSGAQVVIPAPGKKITITQPANGPVDHNMTAFANQLDTTGLQPVWVSAPLDSVTFTPTDYVFNMYGSYSSTPDSGSWCNSDNSGYFGAYPQTSLILTSTDNYPTYQTTVFLIFKNLNSMVHVYCDNYTNMGLSSFTYMYAPSGLQCTVVAVGSSNGQIFSSFTPITIGNNQTVNFKMSPTTSAAFKAAVKALD